MSKKTKAKKIKSKAVRAPEQRFVLVSECELDLLLYLVSTYNPGHRLLHHLSAVKQAFVDSGVRIAELAARANAWGFWENDITANSAYNRQMERMKANHKKRHMEAEREIVCEAAALVKELVAEAEALGRAAAAS